MTEFAFVFSLYSLLLSFSLVALLSGFGKALDAALRDNGPRVGWLVPLLGLFVLLDLLSFFERFCQLTEVGETESSHAKKEGPARLGRSCLGIGEATQPHHLRMQLQPMGLLYHRLNMANQRIHVGGLGGASVDDEIGVQGGDFRATNAVTL